VISYPDTRQIRTCCLDFLINETIRMRSQYTIESFQSCCGIILPFDLITKSLCGLQHESKIMKILLSANIQKMCKKWIENEFIINWWRKNTFFAHQTQRKTRFIIFNSYANSFSEFSYFWAAVSLGLGSGLGPGGQSTPPHRTNPAGAKPSS